MTHQWKTILGIESISYPEYGVLSSSGADNAIVYNIEIEQCQQFAEQGLYAAAEYDYLNNLCYPYTQPLSVTNLTRRKYSIVFATRISG